MVKPSRRAFPFRPRAGVSHLVMTSPPDPPTPDPDTGLGPTSHSYRARRLRLHYVDWGNPAAPPLMMVHGGRDHARNWDWVAADLRRTHHVIAPDLRGHGDSDWATDGDYSPTSLMYDLAQLVHQQEFGPIDILAHSFGGAISLLLAGVFPALVRRMVVIEGVGFPFDLDAVAPIEERLARWVTTQRQVSSRLPRRYPTLDAAFARMREENAHLSEAQAKHLTRHGVMRNEDGSYSWKFDNYARVPSAADLTRDDIHRLWSRIECPVLMVHGGESWVRHPEEGGLLSYFRDARVAEMEGCGHWPHHDRLEEFLKITRAFLAE